MINFEEIDVSPADSIIHKPVNIKCYYLGRFNILGAYAHSIELLFAFAISNYILLVPCFNTQLSSKGLGLGLCEYSLVVLVLA